MRKAKATTIEGSFVCPRDTASQEKRSQTTHLYNSDKCIAREAVHSCACADSLKRVVPYANTTKNVSISLCGGAVGSLPRPEVEVRLLAALEEHARVAALDLRDLVHGARQALVAAHVELHVLRCVALGCVALRWRAANTMRSRTCQKKGNSRKRLWVRVGRYEVARRAMLLSGMRTRNRIKRSDRS